MTIDMTRLARQTRFQVRPYTVRERIQRFFYRHDWIADAVIVTVLSVAALCMLRWLLTEGQ